jgi:hypothetical protein
METKTVYYIAGFLDADGCITAQIVPRKDYVLKFQIRLSVTFFQKTKHHWCLEKLKKECGYGTLRKRNDGMSEYAIVGKDSVRNILKTLEPAVRVKRPQLKRVLHIIDELPKAKDPQTFLTLCESVDHFEQLNFSKRRKNTSATVRSTFEQFGMLDVPVETVGTKGSNDILFD